MAQSNRHHEFGNAMLPSELQRECESDDATGALARWCGGAGAGVAAGDSRWPGAFDGLAATRLDRRNAAAISFCAKMRVLTAC